MPGLREGVTTCLFDLDGVLTDTASVHFAAWKCVFDRVLAANGQGGQPFTRDDYDAHVDGEPREAGVRGFLQAAADAGLAQVRVDGVTLRERRLAGKPAPDSFLAAARRLGAQPGECAVFEDALAGAAAGRAGALGQVVGVDRSGGGPDGEHAAALREHGAGTVVADLSDLLDR